MEDAEKRGRGQPPGPQPLDDNGRTIIREMLVEGAASPAIIAALKEHGYEEVTRQAIHHYRKDPDVIAAIAEANADALESGAANRRVRLRKLDEILTKIESVFAARGEEMAVEGGGAETGIVVRSEKMIGAGEKAALTTEFRVDAPTIHQYRETLRQIAIEVGEYTEKRDISGKVEVSKVKMTDEQRTKRLDELHERARQRAAGSG